VEEAPQGGYLFAAPHWSVVGTTRTFADVRSMSAIEGNPDIERAAPKVRSGPIADVAQLGDGSGWRLPSIGRWGSSAVFKTCKPHDTRPLQRKAQLDYAGRLALGLDIHG
jgi:hypothetical protein